MRTSRTGLLGLIAAALLGACAPEAPPAAAPPPPAAAAAAATPAPASAGPSSKAVAPAGASHVVAVPKPVATELPKIASDQWYRTLEDDQPSGWRHVRWTRATLDGKPVIHDRTESYSSTTRQMGREADTFESRSYTDLDRTEEGLVLRVQGRGVQGDRVSDSVQVWTGKGYDLTSHVAGLEEKRSIACDAPCPADAEAFLSKRLQNGEVSVGQRYDYKSPNFEGQRLDTVSLTVDAKETIETPGGSFECFRVTESVAGQPGAGVTTWWLDAKGIVRKLVSGRTEVVSSTEGKARDLRDGGAVFSITVAAEPEMPRCTSLDRAVVEVTLAPREGLELPDFPRTPFSHELGRKDNVIRLELTSHDEAADAIALPVTDPAFSKHLERTNLFCWDAPRVKAALRTAVGDEKDARQVVKKILRFVFTLRKASGPIPEPTAVEILEDGGGDCSEHCVLFVTLCRAAGVPARRLSGYAQVGDMWGSHSFAEVWLGRWVGCDPTTNDYGTKARYVAFGWNDDADSFPGVVSSRVAGRMSIRTVEFTEGGKTWKTDALPEASDREDVYSGLAFGEPPAGWHANVVAPGQGHVSGPGVRADFTVVAGYGDVHCDMLVARGGMRGTRRAQFCGLEILRDDIVVQGHATISMTIPYKRRMMSGRVRVDNAKNAEAAMATLAKLLAPTLE